VFPIEQQKSSKFTVLSDMTTPMHLFRVPTSTVDLEVQHYY